MITLFQSNKTYPLNEIKAQMTNHIKQLPAKVSLIGESSKIIRHELRCEPVSILTWLHNQKTNTKIYWSDRAGHFEVGGIGIADGIKGNDRIDQPGLFAYMEDRLSADNPHLRYYGGMNFDDSSLDPHWQEFGTYQFIVPQFELLRSDEQATFAFNISINDINNDHIDAVLNDLTQIDLSTATTYREAPQVLKRNDFPDKDEWSSIFHRAHQDNDGAKHEKIVLARRSVFDFDVTLRSDALLKHLKVITPHCYHFCFQFSTNSAFLGATPERLYKRNKQIIKSEAIAGTRPRGKTEELDKEFEEQLLSSSKDAVEHKYVVEAIDAALKPLSDSLRSDDTFSLRKLKGSQHLITRFEGNLTSENGDQQILNALHPTPAVAGCPTQSAMEAIKQLEPFNRGWYAGPVGYVGSDTSEFAVAIRCGLVSGDQLSLYAGAGIVSGSTPEGEWEEIENKISNFIKVFNKKKKPIQEPGSCLR